MRSIAKSMVFRILAVISGFSVTYFFTHSWSVSLGVTVVSNVVAMVLYYAHERMWDRVTWGIKEIKRKK